jgi:hypothetical protein
MQEILGRTQNHDTSYCYYWCSRHGGGLRLNICGGSTKGICAGDLRRRPSTGKNRAWVKSIKMGKPVLAATAWDGSCSTAVVEAVVEALRNGKTVAVRQIAKPKFYMPS